MVKGHNCNRNYYHSLFITPFFVQKICVGNAAPSDQQLHTRIKRRYCEHKKIKKKKAVFNAHAVYMGDVPAANLPGIFCAQRCIASGVGGRMCRIGTFPAAVFLVLNLYNIDRSTGEAFGWLMWGTTTFIVLFFGLICLGALFITHRKKQAGSTTTPSATIV
jgi:hypothetical protein